MRLILQVPTTFIHISGLKRTRWWVGKRAHNSAPTRNNKTAQIQSAVRDARMFTKRKVVVSKTASRADFNSRTEGANDGGGGGPSDGEGVSENDVEIQCINDQATPASGNDSESTHPHGASDTISSFVPSGLSIAIGLEDVPPSQSGPGHEEFKEGNTKKPTLNFKCQSQQSIYCIVQVESEPPVSLTHSSRPRNQFE